MTLRTPRRRISPRTKKRCRAIKNFLRRALGSSSQPNINNTNSSLSVSVSDLKQKLVGIEQQLKSVSKHCQDLACLEYNLKPTNNTATIDTQNNVDSNTKILKEPETKVLYKSSQDLYREPTNSRSIFKELYPDDSHCTKTSENKIMNQNHSFYKEKIRNRRNKLDPIQEQTLRKNRSADKKYSNVELMANHQKFNESKYLGQYRDTEYSEAHRHKRKSKKAFAGNPYLTSENNMQFYIDERCGDHHKNKYDRPELDQEYIAEIIRRQYRPVKLFGRRHSDLSQFSAPVCRDQEFPIRQIVQKGSELCSCCHREQRTKKHSKHMCSNDLEDIRSICDTRLYSSRRLKHTNNRRRLEDYNDSEMYDIFPVKEKTSPKSRRKFAEDYIINYKEVPPSPRTKRPQLNLRAQFHTEDDDEIPLNKQFSDIQKSPRKLIAKNNIYPSNVSSEVFIHNRNLKGIQKSQVPNSPKSPTATNERAINDISLNTQTIDTSAEKTDKTLSEIKDILQSFLLEMKKESSHSEKLNGASMINEQNLTETQQLNNKNSMFNNGYTCNFNRSFGQCAPPLMPSFINPFCYPILPVCPTNCMQNAFVAPSPSFTCTACAYNSTHRACGSNESKNKADDGETACNETQKLIKEIHKLISQNPKSIQKQEYNEGETGAAKQQADTRILTSRSVGGSSKASKHDAQVGTKIKHSKSCEAIGPRLNKNAHYAAYASHSDTALEKESVETTNVQSSSESDDSSESEIIKKKKENAISKMFKAIFKKNKRDGIEEFSECESNADVRRPKAKPPFQHNIMNYNMHGQEYFHPPPVPAYPFNAAHHHSPRTCYSPTHVHGKTKHSTGNVHEHAIRSPCASPYNRPMSPCPNCFEPHYGTASPQVPLCLKEIEVKSIGTQSVRKVSLLQKLTNKMQVPAPKARETPSSMPTSKDKSGNLFDWKKLQAKAMQSNTEPLKFSYKTQKQLAEGDSKMRNAMLKKLFYKRNPLSPRNLLMRALLGKDKSSFGEPPKMYKPRMFI